MHDDRANAARAHGAGTEYIPLPGVDEADFHRDARAALRDLIADPDLASATAHDLADILGAAEPARYGPLLAHVDGRIKLHADLEYELEAAQREGLVRECPAGMLATVFRVRYFDLSDARRLERERCEPEREL